MIPREGVERFLQLLVQLVLHFRLLVQVIPREGVERQFVVDATRAFVEFERVIPREGVESLKSSSVAAIFLSSSDPERGS